MVDRQWIRNIDWTEWTLLDSVELGGGLMLVVSPNDHDEEFAIAACQPLAGWYVSSITRLRHWSQGWTGVPEGRVFRGVVPNDVAEIRLTGFRLESRTPVRPHGIWLAHVPGKRHVRRMDFLDAEGTVVRSFKYVDTIAFWFGGLGRWSRWRLADLRMGSRRRATIDRIPDWESRLTA